MSGQHAEEDPAMPRVSRRAVLAAALAAPAVARAQGGFPDRPLRLVVPFPPGGTADLLGRLAAREMEAGLGQPVVVENRAGAGGAIGSEAVARNAPDGYTLLLSNIASQAIGPAVNRGAPYDPDASFTHLGLIAAVPSAVAVSAASAFRSMADLLAAARARAGAVRFGSNGNGTSSHVKLVLLNRLAGVEITHVPYRGSAPATADVIGGVVEGLIAAVPDIGRNERLRLLMITSERRAARWPDVPSAPEAGFPQLVASNWFGLSGPAGMPAPVAERINAALVAGLTREETANRLRDLGAEPSRMTPAEYAALVRGDIARWGAVVREAGIRAD
jgi:tripartite-type tricarboxylate transporter receptor subunit TctC